MQTVEKINQDDDYELSGITGRNRSSLARYACSDRSRSGIACWSRRAMSVADSYSVRLLTTKQITVPSGCKNRFAST
jgi:hypothetical protein